MAETALKKSRDVKELKKFRSALKGQITSAVSKLEALFARKVEDDFDQGDIFMSEVNQVEAKTYSSSATVATKTKISPSNIGGQDGAKMEGPRCQVLKLLHGAEVGYTNMEPIVVKSLPHRLHECEEMENSVKRCSNLEKLVRSTAHVPRLMGRRLLISGVRQTMDDAWKFLINLEQRKLNLKKQKRLRCSETKILSPWMKKFPFSFSSKKKETSKSIKEPREKIENIAKLIAMKEPSKSIKGVREKIEEINFVASHGGVKYKEWNVSKENFTQEAVSVHLPHTIGVDKEPPGIFWNVSKDEIYSSRLDISYLGGDNTLPLSKALPPISLTIRICLLVHAKTDTKYLSPSCLLPATMKTRFLDKKKEVTSHKPQVTSQEIGSHESQATSQDTGGGVTKMRSQ